MDDGEVDVGIIGSEIMTIRVAKIYRVDHVVSLSAVLGFGVSNILI